MEETHTGTMNYLSWTLISGPVIIINFIINAFYIFCMVCPLHGERIKQPLKLLLSSLIVSTIVYLLAVFGVFLSQEKNEHGRITHISLVFSLGCLSISVSSSVWLNFFYCTQIVPAHRALFIWIKKNIKPIIYCILLVENIYSLLDFFMGLADPKRNRFELNTTSTVEHAFIDIPAEDFPSQAVDIFVIMITIQRSHCYISFVVMMASCGVTVVYLGRHIHRMVINGQSLSSAQLSSQVRVTVTGILQGLLYFSLAVWREYAFVSRHNQSAFISPYILSTVVSFYVSGTTFNLGVGQSVFRQRAADLWSRVGQWCKSSHQRKRVLV